MLIEWIIDALIELPFWLIDAPGRSTCPKCSNRLRSLEGSRGKRKQCVTCDQVWQREKGEKLRPIDANHN